MRTVASQTSLPLSSINVASYDVAMFIKPEQRENIRQLPRDHLCQRQLESLNRLLGQVLPANQFYSDKYRFAGLFGDAESMQLTSFDGLAKLPFTTKQELVGESPQGYAANLTYPIDHYVRFHRTSGTSGRPVIVLDTADDWRWWVRAWQYVLDSVDLSPADRVLMAFSFGPFIGFWSAHDACIARGALVIPGGGLSSLARLELLQTSRATVFFATPSYAIHLADIAKENNIDLATSAISRIVVAGEPGGSIPSIRERIENAWQAQLVDHSGASEIGPWGFADEKGTGLFVNEAEFIAEFRSLEDDNPAKDGELSELVITTLGRAGCPVIRYRTGDLVRAYRQHDHACRFAFLEGGVLGRVDNMMVIRGVNIYPGSIEQVIRGFPEVAEYRMTAFKNGAMDAVAVEVEDALNDPQRIADELNVRIGIKFDVKNVPTGSLPRFEAKGQRFVDNR